MRLINPPHFLRVIDPWRMWGFLYSKNTIYLTFDDGPNPEITPWILDLLKTKNIKATFFCVGENVKKYPEIFHRILEEGHQVGNHTFQHENGKKVADETYLESVEKADQLIQSRLFRPPYGRLRFSQMWQLKKKYRIIMWSWMSYDFDFSYQEERIFKNAKKNIKSGDIIVMHDNDKFAEREKKILPQILQVIENKGFTFEKIK